MTPKQKLVTAAAATGVILVVGIALLVRSAPDPGAPPGPKPDPWAPVVSAPPVSSAPARPAPPTTISGELATPPVEIDHRVVKPEPGRPAPTLAYTYTLSTKLPEVKVKDVPVDVFKKVDERYARQLAASYGLPDQQPFIDGDDYSFIGDITKPGSGILRVNARSGYSDYSVLLPEQGGRPVRTGAEAVAVVRALLQTTKQLPPRLDPPIVYERKSLPNVFFVELHRPWTPLPILETTGMLTADISNRTANRPKDPDVVKTTDRTDGLVRPADFNTITAAVDTNGHVLLLTVNMRPIETSLPARALKAPQAAWEELTSGKGILGLTLPSESKLSPQSWEQIFPKDTATSDNAQVREIILAYVERPDGVRQTYLQPIYLFKGRAKLATGPLADFVVAVPALADDQLPK